MRSRLLVRCTPVIVWTVQCLVQVDTDSCCQMSANCEQSHRPVTETAYRLRRLTAWDGLVSLPSETAYHLRRLTVWDYLPSETAYRLRLLTVWDCLPSETAYRLRLLTVWNCQLRLLMRTIWDRLPILRLLTIWHCLQSVDHLTQPKRPLRGHLKADSHHWRQGHVKARAPRESPPGPALWGATITNNELHRVMQCYLIIIIKLQLTCDRLRSLHSVRYISFISLHFVHSLHVFRFVTSMCYCRIYLQVML